MPDSFFTSSKSKRRKRSAPQSSSLRVHKKFKTSDGQARGFTKGKKPLRKSVNDEELQSDRTDDEDGGGGDVDDMDLERRASEDEIVSGDEDEDETPAQKRLRLAKLYLEGVKESLADGEFDAKEIDRELISTRLKQDVLEHSGKIHLFIADQYDFTRLPSSTIRLKGHRFSVTSAVASESCRHMFTAGKEGHIVKWDLHSGKKVTTFYKQRSPTRSDKKGKGKQPEIRGHTDEVLALAISGDEKILVSGGRDKRVVVWDVESDCWKQCFFGPLAHKDVVSALSFRKGTRQLYTGSNDRTIKVFDLSPSVMGYVETVFGHQEPVACLDALRAETCVSVGGRDKSARFWKIIEQTSLVFRGGGRSRVREVLEGGLGADEADDETREEKEKDQTKTRKFIEGSLECIAMIDESTFLSGGDSGSICLWNIQRKKPIFTQALAHGFHETQSATEGLIQNPRWVTSLASLRYSDIFASGSWEGIIRLWKIDAKVKSFSLVGTIPALGVINSLQLLLAPKVFSPKAWGSPAQAAEGADEQVPVVVKGDTRMVVMVAGLGQEHRLGRWLNVKEGGAVNSAMVVAFPPRTL